MIRKFLNSLESRSTKTVSVRMDLKGGLFIIFGPQMCVDKITCRINPQIRFVIK